MDARLQEQAQTLAQRGYIEVVKLSETTKGNPCYVAYSPELFGCIAQGNSVEEAKENLLSARIDYIHSLLDDKLPVPPPKLLFQDGIAVELFPNERTKPWSRFLSVDANQEITM